MADCRVDGAARYYHKESYAEFEIRGIAVIARAAKSSGRHEI
jgi:hypothetical protein